jgi:hypothetical protein
MTLQDLLTQLVSRGIQLSRAGDRLRYRPVERMTPELAAVIRVHKSELMALSACDCCDCWPLILPESRAAGVCLQRIRRPWRRQDPDRNAIEESDLTR